MKQILIEQTKGAYHPHSNTIYIRNGEPISTLIHELCHWAMHKLRLPRTLHIKLDKGFDGSKL